MGIIGAGVIIAASLLVTGVLALVSDTGTYSVIVADKDHSSGLVSVGNASVEYIGSSANNQSSGTGIFDPFVRLQGSPTENGYNTNGAVQFDTKSGQWTHAILASAIPQVDCDGDGPGTARCWELFNDINENNTAKYISLTKVEIWFANSPTLVGYNETTHTFASGATKQYEFNGEIKINDVNQGSGRGDLRYLVPVISFAATDWFVLYSEWGSPDAAPDGKTFASDGGFEEWKVRKSPNVGIVKTANPPGPVSAGSSIGFDITVSNTGVADATNVTISDPLPAGAGNDLVWSLSPPFAGCSITGAAAPQTLNCTFATLAAGATIGPIHITSGTGQADCAVVSNTATVASGNDGGGTSTATVTVECAAIKIVKNSTKGGAVATTGAVFSYGTGLSVTDNGTGDQDSAIGSVCVSGLAPGNYTVNETTAPTGYGDAPASEADQVVTAVNGTNCSSNLPAAGATATFTNAPLYDLQVNFRDGGSGETSITSISCTNVGTADTTPATGWDASNTYTGESAPQTVVCTIVVDP